MVDLSRAGSNMGKKGEKWRVGEKLCAWVVGIWCGIRRAKTTEGRLGKEGKAKD
jgi:hypothetical protein